MLNNRKITGSIVAVALNFITNYTFNSSPGLVWAWNNGNRAKEMKQNPYHHLNGFSQYFFFLRFRFLHLFKLILWYRQVFDLIYFIFIAFDAERKEKNCDVDAKQQKCHVIINFTVSVYILWGRALTE